MRASSVSGVLQGPDGQPAANYTVVVFSSESRYWTPQSRRIQAARPATDGRFSFRDLPPGEYRLAAIGDVEPGQWFDPLFLRQLTAASMPVSIGEGERKTQDLRLLILQRAKGPYVDSVGCRSFHSVACSYASATLHNVASSYSRPVIITSCGWLLYRPHFSEIAG